MNTLNASIPNHYNTSHDANRQAVIESLPVTERRLEIAGLQTAVLEGGSGPPVILLHGPGESSLWWLQSIPRMVEYFRVIVPDLPGHGETSTEMDDDESIETQVINWLDQLISQTCDAPPVLIGHILGSSIAARYAIRHPDRFRELVLVDSLGLVKFRPTLGFAFNLIRFSIRPSRKNYYRFFSQCMHNYEALPQKVGEPWEPLVEYYLSCQDKKRMAAMHTLMKHVGTPVIPPEELEKIQKPVSLIWGRHDRANKVHIAEKASKRYGWPLFIIENCGDDPKLEQPEAFLKTVLELLQPETEYSTNYKHPDTKTELQPKS